MIVFTQEHCISIAYRIFLCIYESKLYNAVFAEGTCLNIDSTQNTLQHEGIHITFSANDEKFVLLQLTCSVSFKTL